MSLYPPAAVRKLWRHVAGCRQKPTFLRRAQAFVDALHHQAIHRLGVNGMVHPPEVRWHPPDRYEHGTYVVSLLKADYAIYLNEGWPLERMKETLLHECQHHVDSQSKAPRMLEQHGKEWSQRLAAFKHRLGKTAERYSDQL